MIRVAIADDSAFTCRLLASYVEAAGDCAVVGVAHDAPSTLALVERVRPDVLTLDLDMPGGDGLDLLRGVTPHTSVVVISGVTRRAAAVTLRALELGAVDFVLKYTPGAPASPESLRREIVAKVVMAATARNRAPKWAGERAASTDVAAAHGSAGSPPRPAALGSAAKGKHAVIVIGASTGGPQALCELLGELPADFSTPCVIVQHLPSAFTAPFAAQLGRHARLPVFEARDQAPLEPGRLIVSPGGCHLALDHEGRIAFRPAAEDDLYRPSIDVAMASAADVFGPAATGVVLSGMGHDGAEGLSRIRARGGRGYVQAPESCVIDSMPTRALASAGADFIGAPDRIGAMLAGRRSL